MSKVDILLEFVPEALDYIQEAESIILKMEEIVSGGGEYDTELIHTLFRCFHTIKGSSGLLKLEGIVKLTHEAETLLDILRKDSKLPNVENSQVLLSACDQLKKLFYQVESTRIDPVLDENSLTLIGLLQEQIQLFKKEPESPKKKKAFEIFEDEPVIQTQTEKRNENNNDYPNVNTNGNGKIQQSMENSLLRETSVTQSVRKEIKVANEKLDALMDMMGELVIAESNVTQHPMVKNLKEGSFPQALNLLRKIVFDMQEVVLSTRMIPVSGVFQRMSRLVRDLQKKSFKKVNLHIDGEETQIDKSIVDLIADPIIHILRNSVDHGIETIEERLLAGKSETGNIYLSARQSVNEVWILIRDDGRGLNKEKILKKAIDTGLFSGDPNLLSEKEIFNLIFLPGLSTAKEITDISGRGVGMDIVKQNIEKLGGKIDIFSTLGKETSFILRLPLTLGIMEGTVVRVGTSFFTIQTVELKEFVGLRDKSTTVLEEGKEVYEIRGKFIPSFSMNQILNHKSPLVYDNKNPLLIVLEYEEQMLGIKVDEVMGNHNVVIKPLQGKLEEAENVNGFTILGNGDVSLILDIRSIFQRFLGTVK